MATCDVSALTVSVGTLSPPFDPTSMSYTVTSDATSLGVPFTVTPTGSAGCSFAVNGTAVASGTASLPIALVLTSPTAIDVAVNKRGVAGTTHYALVVPPVQEAYIKPSTTHVFVDFSFDSPPLFGRTQ